MRAIESSELQSTIKSFKTLCSEMEKPNMFIMPYDNNNPLIIDRFEKVVSYLRKYFDVKVFESKHGECDLFTYSKCSENLSFKCIAVDSGKTEKIRDAIKELLWPTENDSRLSPSLHAVLSANETTTPKNFDLSEYGEFVPYKAKKYADIRTHSFNHKPVFYRYRVAVEKVTQLPANLQSFLQLLFTDCPNHLFQKSEFRASARTSEEFKVKLEMEHSHKHELIVLAKKSESLNQFKSRHENLQKYFLLNDPRTVACEVPLWLEANEIADYVAFFSTDDVLTGHVDVLRYEQDGRAGVWDYKPGAAEEVNASIQVWLYALMFSIRTGISLQNITCGYFDETSVFSFDPTEIVLIGS